MRFGSLSQVSRSTASLFKQLAKSVWIVDVGRYKVRYTILATKLCSDVNLFVAKFEQVVLNQFRSEINHDELMPAHALNFRMDVLAQHRCEHEIRDGQGIPNQYDHLGCIKRCCGTVP